MKKAIALIPFLARRRRRAQAERGAKLGGPVLLALAGAAAALVVRRRKRSQAGFDASPSELSDRQPGTTTPSGDAPDAPAPGQGRPSTLEGDPAESVPLAASKGIGEDAVVPDTATDDPLVRDAEAAAAAEAGSIGGDVPATPPSNEPGYAGDPATRASEEHAGSAYESFSERES